MRIEVTSPSPQVAQAVRQHLGLSPHAYELWFLGDMFNSRVKNRRSFDALLKEAHECLQHAVDANIIVGGVEIIEVDSDGKVLESVWSMNVDEFKKTL